MLGHPQKGRVGIGSRSGTRTMSGISNTPIAWAEHLRRIAATPVARHELNRLAGLFDDDQQTKGIVHGGEIGGATRRPRRLYSRECEQTVVPYIAGVRHPGQAYGPSGAIVAGGKVGGGHIRALEGGGGFFFGGFTTVSSPAEMGRRLRSG